jgi:hypothetical protein
LALPLVMVSVSVSGNAEAVDSVAALNGPSPVPLDVPEASAAPPAVDRISNSNWSAAAARAAWICMVRRIEANRTANIAPCSPLPTIVVTTCVGVVLPTI